jgi:hypothetical protein
MPPVSASLWPPEIHMTVRTSGTARIEHRHSLWWLCSVCAYLIRPVMRVGAVVCYAVFYFVHSNLLVNDVI